jgi:hypothetical protein
MRKLLLFSITLGLTLLSVISIMSFINIPQINVKKSNTLLPVFDTYENEVYGINIQYPHSWEKVDFSGGNLVVAFDTTDWKDAGLAENVVLQTTESESYNGVSPKDLATRAVVIYKSHIPNFSLLNSAAYTTPAGLSVYKIEYAHTSGELKINTLEVWTVNGDGDDLFRIIFSADNTEYSNFLQTVDKMIDSFTLKNQEHRSSLVHV